MADDDNKIVIPVEVTGIDNAKSQFESLSETMQRVVAKQAANANISTDEFLRRGQELSSKIAEANAKNGNFSGPPPLPGAPRRESSAPPNLEKHLLDESAEEVGKSAEAIRLFREAVHTLHPALAEAGVGLGELTAFTYAARGGVIALGAAVGAYLVTALEKAGDEIRSQSTRLGAFAGGPREGRESFEEVSHASDQLRVRASTLTGPYESLLRANQSSGDQAPATQHELIDALKNLTVATRADSGDNTTKNAALDAFLKRTQEKGFVDPVDQVKEILPKTFASILEQLKKDNPDKQSFTSQDLIRTTSGHDFGDRSAREAAERAKVNADGISEAFDALKTSADKLLEAAGGGHIVSTALGGVAHLLDLVREGLEKLKHHPLIGSVLGDAAVGGALGVLGGPLGVVGGAAVGAGAGALVGTARDITAGRQGSGTFALPNAADIAASSAPTLDLGELHGGTGGTTGREAAEALHGVAEALRETTEAAEKSTSAQKTFNEVALNPKAAIEKLGAVDARKQAGIDLAFQPEEQSLKLARDRLAVETSITGLARARLAVEESGKRRQEAALAPEEARENLNSAQRRRDSALSKFLKNRGVDTSSLDDANAQGQDQEELESAETALKRAKIQKKYSYLEPQKAELDAQGTEIALKSAEIEKQDKSLALAKDEAGQPLARDLAQLRYSSAILKESETANKIGEEQLGVLRQILNKNEEQAKKDTPSSQRTSDQRAAATSDSSNSEPQRVNQSGGGYKTFRYENGQRIDTTGVPEQQPQPQQPQPSSTTFTNPNGTSVENEWGDKTSKVEESLTKLGDAFSSTATKIDSEGEKLSVTEPSVARARGGPIHGPGTSTSDSVLVAASDGEFYHQASSVQHYGLDFMHSVNNKTFPKFSLGGLLSGGIAIPRFATGGPVQTMAPGITDLQHYGTVDLSTNYGEHRAIVQEDTMRHVSNAAVQARTMRAGRSPGWAGGGT